MLQRFLDPQVLASISSLDLVAKTVVDGFIAGLHRSPDFGFSQEFAEYRMYSPGDDLRHVDWNVFARTEKMFLKRYRGETNTQLTVLLDASKSVDWSHGKRISKFDYARFLAASLVHLASQQRDAVGLMLFDSKVVNYVRPASRQGQLHRVLHALESASPAGEADFRAALAEVQQFLKRRGLFVVVSDFYCDNPEERMKLIAPLRGQGSEVVLFHLLDPVEYDPRFIRGPIVLKDSETGEEMEVTGDSFQTAKRDAHLAALSEEARKLGIDYRLVFTDKPLDGALREYLSARQGRN
jgi:uncharacterized protein (DUF58 family)